MIEDKLLLWRLKRGDRAALQRIYLKYKNDLLKLAVSLAADVSSAEDVVHDVFVSFAQSAGRLHIQGNLKAYLLRSVVNRIRTLYRNSQRHAKPGLEETTGMPSTSDRPEHWLILNEQLDQLRHAMAQISLEQREVISLYMQGDLTFRQIAALQDVSINTVQGRYRYGINKLRELLNGKIQ